MEKLHAATVAGLGVARVAWEEDDERALIVAPLSASGQTVAEIFDEAEEWEAAWEEIDPAWMPMDGLTLSVFQGLLSDARAVERVIRRARPRRRRRAEARMARAVGEVDRISKRWYGGAVSVFEAGTFDGDEIRKRIPTTYVPRYAEAAKRRRKEKKAAEQAARAAAAAAAGAGSVSEG